MPTDENVSFPEVCESMGGAEREKVVVSKMRLYSEVCA
jgi:hypothetical protein